MLIIVRTSIEGRIAALHGMDPCQQNREIGRLLTFQNPASVYGHLALNLWNVAVEANQAASGGKMVLVGSSLRSAVSASIASAIIVASKR